jgi:REP element-mobilizing transposase RayT
VLFLKKLKWNQRIAVLSFWNFHYRVKGECYFFTVALAERRASLLTENLEGLRAAFREVKQAYPFEMCDIARPLAL